VLRYKLCLCHTPIKPDLHGFLRIRVLACGLLDQVFKKFVSHNINFMFYHEKKRSDENQPNTKRNYANNPLKVLIGPIIRARAKKH
jgi:hypothetical protein